jgi:hypothetical protein
METITYRDLLKELDSVDAWLRERGLKQLDRIRRNKADIALLADAFDEGRLDKLINDITDDRRRGLMWSLAESTEFVDSIDGLRKQGCEIPIAVLEAALDGPADLQSETEKSNRGRNTMFEIAVAGRLARSGLSPRLGEEPDVFVEFDKRRVFIQCKRVFSENGISKRVIDAGKQLKRDLARSLDPRDCGVIAISVSRVFNKGDKLLVAHDEGSLRQKLRDEIDSIRAAVSREYRHVTEPKVAGIYYHLGSPAFLEGMGLYVGAHSVTVATIPGKSDHALIENLAKSLVTR